MSLRMYILVNSDIKIGKGKLPGQVGHAVATYFYRNLRKDRERGTDVVPTELIDEYMENGRVIVILSCPLSRLEELENEGHITIRDKGYTHLPPNTLTCVNMGLYEKEKVPDWVSELKLYS